MCKLANLTPPLAFAQSGRPVQKRRMATVFAVFTVFKPPFSK
jgi:hypothetical protein